MEGEQEVKSKSSSNWVVIGAIILGLVVLGGGLLVSNQNASQKVSQTRIVENQPEVAGASQETKDAEVSMEEGVNVIKVEAGSFYYNPKEIRVKLGDKVKIELTAADMMHDLNIDELGVDGPVIKAGETTDIEFTADTAGEFEYYCSVGQHRANGQVGTLIVEE